MFDILNHPINDLAFGSESAFKDSARKFREVITDPCLGLQFDTSYPNVFRSYNGKGKISLNFCGAGLPGSLGGVGSPRRLALLQAGPGLCIISDDVRNSLLTKQKLDKNDIHAEHPVPCCILSEIGIMNGYTGYQLWSKFGIIGFCTAKENKKLRDEGLTSKMPPNWDGVTKTARWDAVGIPY